MLTPNPAAATARAQQTANAAKSTADKAQSTANTAQQTASAAQQTANGTKTSLAAGNLHINNISTLSTPQQLFDLWQGSGRRLILTHVDAAGGTLKTKLDAIGANTGDFYCYFMGDGGNYGLLILSSPRSNLLAVISVWAKDWGNAVNLTGN